MAERWQQWMPFHIDRFRGSPEVQAMHPAARCGFIYLLSSAWQTDDCSLSADPLDLATESGLGDELWAIHGPRIIRKFRLSENGRLVNDVLTIEWNQSFHKYLANKKRAESTNEKRGANAGRTSDVPESNVERTHLQEQEQIHKEALKPLASTAVAVPASPSVFTFPLTGKKTHIVTVADCDAWSAAYPAVDVRAELRRVLVWLDANEDKRSATVKGSKKRINTWLSRTQDAGGRKGAGNGTFAGKTESSATVGMQRTPPSEDEIAAALAIEEAERLKVIAYWRDVRARGRPEQQMPTWVKKELEAA